MPTHPMYEKLQNHTKNRLKKHHLTKTIHRQHKDLLLSSPDEMEMLHDYEEPASGLEELLIITEVPGINKKDSQAPPKLKALTLEMIEAQYNPREWTHVFTDGSSEEAVINGGAGIFIKHTDGTLTSRAFPTGRFSSNFRAEAAVLLHAAQILYRLSHPTPKIAFFTDCISLLQGLQSTKNDQQLTGIRTALYNLSRQSTVILQWVPYHCGVNGN